MSLRSSFLALLATIALVGLGACDSYNDDDTSLEIAVVDFSFDDDDYDVGGDFRTATYDARDADVERGDLDFALEQAGDGALVMLYIDVELVSAVEGAEGNRTYAALPLTRGFEEIVLGDDGDGGTTTVPVVGYTASYEYSFDNQDLYFDVVSSADYRDFSDDPESLFSFIRPQRVLGGSSDLDFRLVVIPDERFFVNGRASAQIDMRDYEAVKAAYNLPD